MISRQTNEVWMNVKKNCVFYRNDLSWLSTGGLIDEQSLSIFKNICSKFPLQKKIYFQAWTTAWLDSSCFWHEKCLSTLSLTICLRASLLLCPGSGKTIHHLTSPSLIEYFSPVSSSTRRSSRAEWHCWSPYS